MKGTSISDLYSIQNKIGEGNHFSFSKSRILWVSFQGSSKMQWNDKSSQNNS